MDKKARYNEQYQINGIHDSVSLLLQHLILYRIKIYASRLTGILEEQTNSK